MNKYLWIALALIIVSLCYWSGLIGMFLSDYKTVPIYRAANVHSERELIEFKEHWIAEIVDNQHLWRCMLWIPNSDNASGFIEISYYERKSSWWEIW